MCGHKPNRKMKLPSQTKAATIETEEENERMLKVIEKLMEKGEHLSPEEEKLLKLLTKLVEDFEERYYHPRDATPLEVLHHLIESRGTKQTHLWEVFGSGDRFRSTKWEAWNQQDSRSSIG